MIITLLILWAIMGYYGMFILLRSCFDIEPFDLFVCLFGCVFGPVILITGLIAKYSKSKVLFKQYGKD